MSNDLGLTNTGGPPPAADRGNAAGAVPDIPPTYLPRRNRRMKGVKDKLLDLDGVEEHYGATNQTRSDPSLGVVPNWVTSTSK